jgi:hypothetical protein
LDRIYALLSSLIIHIYQLHIVQSAPSAAQINRVSVCMFALESVSAIWLVATAVQSIFESILISSGYDKQIEATSRYSFWKHHEDAETKVDEELNNGKGENHETATHCLPPGSHEMSTRLRFLTPALREWADVTVKYTDLPKALGSQKTKGEVSEPLILRNWKDSPQDSFASSSAHAVSENTEHFEYYEYGIPQTHSSFPQDSNTSWNGNATPPLTGFNAAEW